MRIHTLNLFRMYSMIFQARLFWVERLVEFVSSWLWVWPCFICSTFYRNEEWGEDDWNVSIAFTPYQQPSVRTHRQHGGYLSKTDNLLSIVTVHLKTKKLWCQVNIFNSLFWIGRKTETQEYHLVWACCEDVLKNDEKDTTKTMDCCRWNSKNDDDLTRMAVSWNVDSWSRCVVIVPGID